MTNVTITISTNTINDVTTALFRLGDEIKITQYVPSFCAGVNLFNSGNAELIVDCVDFFGFYDKKKVKYLQRYRRRGERMKKG